MTNEDKVALKEFLSGVAVVIVTVASFILLLILLFNKNPEINNSPTTEVVGQYKECEIVRWNSNDLAEYKYFLYCGKN